MSATFGGYSKARTDVNELLQLIQGQEGLMDEIKSKIGAEKEHAVNLVDYTSQTVAGTNYKAVFHNETNGKKHEVTLFRPLPHTGAPICLTGVAAIEQVQ